ncbi:SGNH/GDSL hydrolase family protein [Streptomyces sulphureus]|uniref:SGNH/GDSL hydrolase family protein n=1 Tax=Streptomyces sulphureus TaxID=47758 RepID=UPI000381DFC4|nr:SGNH/GDSL hydrolase family protein [Streptomyces sulphureus]
MQKDRRSNGRRLAAGALAALGLLGAAGTAPAHAESAPEVYVALGDSMASGPLIPDITGLLACGRSTHNYGHELAKTLGVDEYRDVTCSGAKSQHMTEPQKLSLAGVPAGEVPPQLDAVRADTTLVTLTVGGNDAGLVGVAQDCVQLDPRGARCQDEYTEDGVDTVAQRIEEFGPKLGAVLDGIAERAPQARVVVTAYGDYVKPGGCYPAVPVLPSDADWLQGGVNHLNEVIGEQSAAHGARYVDLFTPSRGHDACAAPKEKWVEGFVPTDLAAPLHPNRRGEGNYARIINEQLPTAR